MYLYKKTMKHKNTAAKITAALFLICGAALLLLSSSGQIAYPVFAQILSVILIGASVYIAVSYLLREYTFSVTPSSEFGDEKAEISERINFVITEAKGKKNIKVCQIGLDEIKMLRIVNATNKKTVAKERKNMLRYTYDTRFAASQRIEIVANVSGDDYSILVSYEEELLRVLKDYTYL